MVWFNILPVMLWCKGIPTGVMQMSVKWHERERERERKRSTAIVLLRNRHDILVNTWSLLSTFPDSHISSRLTRPLVVDYGVQNSALAIIQLPGRSIYLSYTQYISPALKKQFLCYFSGKTTNSGIKITIFVFIWTLFRQARTMEQLHQHAIWTSWVERNKGIPEL